MQGLVVFGVTYCIGVGLRLWELPFWLAGDFRVDGQWLQATHDAYLWLSAAEDVPFSGRMRQPSLFISFWAQATGWSPALLAFYAPAIMAPLLTLPVCLVASRWHMPEAGLWAGLMAALAPGIGSGRGWVSWMTTCWSCRSSWS